MRGAVVLAVLATMMWGPDASIGVGSPVSGYLGWSYLDSGGSTWYFYNDVGRFSFNNSTGKWSGYDKYGGKWQTLSGAGASASYIFDGTSHDLRNGWSYLYSASTQTGNWLRSGAVRFGYNFSEGRWYGIDPYGGGWQRLSAPLRPSSFVGNGTLQDLGNNWAFVYGYAGDTGNWARSDTSAARFSYNYSTGRWSEYDPGTSTWKTLSSVWRSASFVGNGVPKDLGNNWVFVYSYASDTGNWARSDTSAARFGYNYSTGLWSEYDPYTSSWKSLSSPGRSAAFIGSGALYDLNNGWNFTYTYSTDQGIWATGGADRFEYNYTLGQWYFWQKDAWQSLGQLARSSRFIGDGDRHELTEGPWTYYTNPDGMLIGTQAPYWTWDMRYDVATDTMYIGLETSLYEELHPLLEMFRFRFAQAEWDDRNLVWNKWNYMRSYLLVDTDNVESLEWSFTTPREQLTTLGLWGFPLEQEEFYQYTCYFGGRGTQRPESTIKRTIVTWDYVNTYTYAPPDYMPVYAWTPSYNTADAYRHDLITAEWWYCINPTSAAPYWEWNRVGDTTRYGWRPEI
ncbi:MAG: hypothetical protein HY912_23150 [Desulfomonile tiedjei]|uniref:Uncharacterized protein n=1 Tax=Desulfomonile tiedjei TaxID=2358 RepID=A0A9D6Z2N1_9BACT|nr:hypothetical protein [Desulfomonile tiedjei]